MDLLRVSSARFTLLALAVLVGALATAALGHEEHVRVVVTETETTILDVVEFAPGTAVLHASSVPTLDAVADTLRGNPSIELIEVQSHTATANQALSDERATVIVNYLVNAGIEPSRLTAQGYSDTQPIDPAAPQKNERVCFLILRRS